MTKLTELVLQYQQTGAGYEELKSTVEQWVYYYPTTRPGFSEEDSAEFLLHFRGKIPSLLEKYVHTDRSFEAYLATTLRWQLRSFARTRRRRARVLELTRSPDVWDGLLGVAETPSSGTALRLQLTLRLAGAPQRRAPRRSVARRLVVLAMKASAVVEERQLAALADLTGYSFEWLSYCRTELLEMVDRREKRRKVLRERRNAAFFRIRVAQDELADAVRETRREVLRAELDKQTKRLENARRQLARVPAVPTNGEIASVLGIPKGSVDSALHQLKRNLEMLQEQHRN